MAAAAADAAAAAVEDLAVLGCRGRPLLAVDSVGAGFDRYLLSASCRLSGESGEEGAAGCAFGLGDARLMLAMLALDALLVGAAVRIV